MQGFFITSLINKSIYKNQKLQSMKNLFFVLLVLSVAFTGCKSVRQIGKVNMISNRNVDPSMKYQVITTYSGGSKNEFKKSKALSIEDAIDQTVRKVPGGEFIMNAKIYLLKEKYIAVEGDVWGNAGERSYRGFKVGDFVTWKTSLINGNKYLKGTISTLKDDKKCLVKLIDTDKTVELQYDEISKTAN